jgi:hypothetical protein
MRTCHRSYKKAQSCITFILPPPPFFFYVYIATPKNLESCRGAASQPPAVPCFQFPPLYPFFRTQYLIGPILLRTRFCESSCKQKKLQFHVHQESHLSCYFRSCIYLSIPLPCRRVAAVTQKRLHSTS